jgi:LmbE family N-acetylglucosaminyl deacetylase
MSDLSKYTVIFFTPHADDIELGIPFMYLESLRLGNKVVEVVMTNNAYGTEYDKLKGKRLEEIRIKELDEANRVFEKASRNKVKVIRMGYIDGHLPLNNESLNKVMNLIKQLKPAIIFAPDPWFAQDFHADHLNTGRLVFFSLKKLKRQSRPKRTFYYYSTKTHFYLKCRWKDFKIVKEALEKHKSQYSSFQSKLILTFYNKLSILRHLLETKNTSESLREQKLSENGQPLAPPKFNDMSFRDRVIYYLFSNTTIWGYVKFYNFSPEQLGFNMNYKNKDLLKSLDKRYKYRYQNN